MDNRSAAELRKRKKHLPSPVKFEIIYPSPRSKENLLSAVGGNLKSVLDTGRGALGELYTSAARAVLELKEAFEDRRAERRARLPAASHVRRSRFPPKTLLIESNAHRKRRSKPPSKSGT
jgi:hypothetical protein